MVFAALVAMLGLFTPDSAAQNPAAGALEIAAAIDAHAKRPFDHRRSYTLPNQRGCSAQEFPVVALDPMDEKADMTLTFEIYRPDRKTKSDSIVMYTPAVGVSLVDRSFAKAFCHKGFTTLIIAAWPGSHFSDTIVNPKVYHERMVRAYHAARHAIEILGGNVGVFGISLGGVDGLGVGLTLPDRVKAVSTLVAAHPVSDVIARSGQWEMAMNRRWRMKQYRRWIPDMKAYQKWVRSYFPIEPMSYLQYSRLVPHQFFIATGDETIPTDLQRWTAKQFLNSDIYEMDGGHIPTVLRIHAFSRVKVTDFFVNHLQ